MTHPTYRFYMIVISVIMIQHFSSAQYNVEVKGIIDNNTGQCLGELQLSIEGDAGPFSVVVYNLWGDIVGELLDVDADVHVMSPFTQFDLWGGWLEIIDAYGCGETHTDLIFDCICDSYTPDVQKRITPCTMIEGKLIVVPYTPEGMIQSVEWLDWQNFATASDQRLIENLDAGTYCGLFSFTHSTVNDHDQECFDLEFCFDIENSDCHCSDYNPVADITHATGGQNNGRIALTLYNGTPPFTFNWVTGQTGPIIDNLSPGIYSVFIQDSSCGDPILYEYEVETSCDFFLISGEPEYRDPVCVESNGRIWVDADTNFDILGEYGTIDMECINMQTGLVESIESIAQEIEIGNTGTYTTFHGWSTINGLSSGDYKIVATDDLGCSDEIIVELSESDRSDEIEIISLNTIRSCTGMDNGVIDLTVVNNLKIPWGETKVELSNGMRRIFTTISADVSFEDLGPGMYQIVITDISTGCLVTLDVEIEEMEIIPMTETGNPSEVIRPVCIPTGAPGIRSYLNFISGGNPPFRFEGEIILSDGSLLDLLGISIDNFPMIIDANYRWYRIVDHCGQTSRIFKFNPHIGWESCDPRIENIDIKNPNQGQSNGSISIDLDYNECTNQSNIKWISHPWLTGRTINNLSSGTYIVEIGMPDCFITETIILTECTESISLSNVDVSRILDMNCLTGMVEFSVTVNQSISNLRYALIDGSGEVIREGFKDIDPWSLTNKIDFNFHGLPKRQYQLLIGEDCAGTAVKSIDMTCVECGSLYIAPIYSIINEPCDGLSDFLDLDRIEMQLKTKTPLITGEFLIDIISTYANPPNPPTFAKIELINGQPKVTWEGDTENIRVDQTVNNIVGIVAHDLTRGCYYITQHLVGPPERNCFVEEKRVGDFGNSNNPLFDNNDIVIPGSFDKISCGSEHDRECIQFREFLYHPFDNEDPYNGGGIVRIGCATLNYENGGIFHDDQYIVIPPCTPHIIFDTWSPIGGCKIDDIHLVPQSESVLVIFDLPDKVEHIAIHYKGELPNPEVLQIDEPQCNGIAYAVPLPLNDQDPFDDTDNCTFDIYCLEDCCGYGSCEPRLIERRSVVNEESCCVFESERDGYPVCIQRCECDIGYYSEVERKLTDMSNLECQSEYPDCDEKFQLISEEVKGCGKVKLRFRLPETGTVQWKAGYHVDVQCDSDPIGYKSKHFAMGNQELEIKFKDFNNDDPVGYYVINIRFKDYDPICIVVNTDYECSGSFHEEEDPEELTDPEGCDKVLSSSSTGETHNVEFAKVLTQGDMPVMMLGPLTGNDPVAASAKMSNLSPQGFDLAIQEWGLSDGLHDPEKVSYQYAPTGNFNLQGVETEFKNIEGITESYQWVYFDKPFTQLPIVNATVVSNANGDVPVTVRITAVSKTRFRVKLQQQEFATSALQPEVISYMAFGKGQGELADRRIAVGRTPKIVNHNWTTIHFNVGSALGANYAPIQNPQFFAFMQTNTGNEPAVLRYRNLTDTSVELMVQEENSLDQEIYHGTEIVGYVLMDAGLDCCNDVVLNVDHLLTYDQTCGAPNSGYIESDPNQTAPSYLYEWDNGSTGPNNYNLSAGNYTVTVTDSDGCTFEETFEINANDGLGLNNPHINHPTCSSSTGSIDPNVYGGQEPYSYAWSTGANSSTINNLSEGSYSVTVSDAQLCTGEMTYELSELDLYQSYEVLNPVCGSDNGSILGEAYGGNPPYTYQWADGSSSSDRSGLVPGTYEVTVTDNDGCVETRSFTLVSDNSIDISSNGGDEGFIDGRFIEAGTWITWDFDPQGIADQLIITSSTDVVIVNTGAVTNNSSCHCNNASSCSCADFFLGDMPNSTFNLIVGEGTTFDPVGSCTYGSGHKEVIGVSGTFNVNTDSYITVEVIPNSCGFILTAWSVNLTCGSELLSPEEIEIWRMESVDHQQEAAEVLSSIDDLERAKNSINIFPNPAKNIVHIRSNDLNSKFDMQLLDLNGKEITQLSDAVGQTKIALEDIPQGVYVVTIDFHNGQRIVKKLIVK